MKKIIATAAFVAAAAAVTAQTVTSANIVGYNKDTAPSGLHIAAMQFEGEETAVPSLVFGDQLPVGSKIYAFNGVNYDTSTFIDDFDEFFNPIQRWSPDAVNLGSAVGFWVENNSGAQVESILSGEVPMATAITNNIVSGLQLISYPYPVELDVDELGFSPSVGDKIYIFNGVNYNTSTYIDDFDEFFNPIQVWSPVLSVDVGEGFWYEAVAPTTWIANRPF